MYPKPAGYAASVDVTCNVALVCGCATQSANNQCVKNQTRYCECGGGVGVGCEQCGCAVLLSLPTWLHTQRAQQGASDSRVRALWLRNLDSVVCLARRQSARRMNCCVKVADANWAHGGHETNLFNAMLKFAYGCSRVRALNIQPGKLPTAAEPPGSAGFAQPTRHVNPAFVAGNCQFSHAVTIDAWSNPAGQR